MPSDNPPAKRTVQLEVWGATPLMLAVRDGDEAWQALSTESDGEYSFEVTSRYQVVTVCGNATRFGTTITNATALDGKQSVYCYAPSAPPPTVKLSGTVNAPGTVSVDFEVAKSTSSSWSFELDVEPGMHSVFALSSSSVLLERDVSIEAATDVGTLDLASALPWDLVPVVIPDRSADETVNTTTAVYTLDGMAELEVPGTTARFAPSTVLTDPYDGQFSWVTLTTPTTQRRADVEETSGTATINLLPRLEGVSFTETGATWGSLPTGGRVTMFHAQTHAQLTMSATARYLEGMTELAAPEISGMDPAWQLDPVAPRKSRFTVSVGTQSTAVLAGD